MERSDLMERRPENNSTKSTDFVRNWFGAFSRPESQLVVCVWPVPSGSTCVVREPAATPRGAQPRCRLRLRDDGQPPRGARGLEEGSSCVLPLRRYDGTYVPCSCHCAVNASNGLPGGLTIGTLQSSVIVPPRLLFLGLAQVSAPVRLPPSMLGVEPGVS
jgi:hypothetical protein